MGERRCPTCNKLVATTSADFVGSIVLFCARCKTRFGSDSEAPRLTCRECRKWLLSGSVAEGYVRAMCSWCSILVEFGQDTVRIVETPERTGPKLRPKPIPKADLVEYIEDRWQLLRLDNVHRSVDTAVGLRFDVFARDGFRCRYCGRGASQGVYLEADHVVPRSAGGLDTMENLVTACWDCNRGKSAKTLDEPMDGMRIMS